MAETYRRSEQINDALYNPGLYVTDYKGTLDATWEGYARGYSAMNAAKKGEPLGGAPAPSGGGSGMGKGMSGFQGSGGGTAAPSASTSVTTMPTIQSIGTYGGMAPMEA